MKTLKASLITESVSELCVLANIDLRGDVLSKLKAAATGENSKRAREILQAIVNNAKVAKKKRLAICQDTGMPCVFVEIGQDVRVKGDLKAGIIKGVESGYKKGFLRNSIVSHPLLRTAPAYLPPVIHIDIVKGSNLKLTVLPKGFGCENKTQLKMFTPTTGIEEIKGFIVGIIKSAGPDACPPYVVGVGIGGTADYACLLAKKALLRRVHSPQSTVHSQGIKKIEGELLREINALNIGPMGLGGKTTALAVNIETYATHIAGLPVAVNISCHALRSATAVL